MRIAQMVSSYHPLIGGVETHVRRLAQGCAEAGDHVTVLTHQVGGPPADEWIDAVRVRRFPLTVVPRLPAFTEPVPLSEFHAADFDLVHVHSYHTLVGHAASAVACPWSSRRTIMAPATRPCGPFSSGVPPRGCRLFKAADASFAFPRPNATW